MSIIVKKNVITITDEELDIYIADELKDTLLGLFNKGKKTVTINLENVEKITTPAAQVIISARKTFKELRIINAGGMVSDDLQKIGVVL